MALFSRLAADRTARFVAGLRMSPFDRVAEVSVPKRLSSSYRLRSFGEFAPASGGEMHELLPVEQSRIPMPTFYGGGTPAFLAPHDAISVAVPAACALSVRSAIAVGKCDLFFCDDAAVHADQFDLVRHLSPEESSGAAKVDAKKGNIRLGIPTSVRRLPVANAVSLLGGATHNYVHWLTETLPKLLLLDRSESHRDLPLLIDDDLHPNIRAALDIFNVHGRKTIEVKRHEPVHADRLVFISPPSYVPFEYRTSACGVASLPRPDDLIFSPTAIGAVREIACGRSTNQAAPPFKKLYLRRNSTYRRIVNLREIEAVLAAAGFEFVEPEKLSFQQQLDVFRSASCIVTQGGAALGNLCFAPQGCLVLALAACSKDLNYHYFSSLAAILGHRFYFVVGDEHVTRGGPSSSGDFRIDPVHLAGALSSCDSALAAA